MERLESMGLEALKQKERTTEEDITNLKEEIMQRDELLKFIEELISKKYKS
jgi:hypothetical protein